MVEQIEAGINDAASIFLIGPLVLLSRLGIPRAVVPLLGRATRMG